MKDQEQDFASIAGVVSILGHIWLAEWRSKASVFLSGASRVYQVFSNALRGKNLRPVL